MRRNRFTWDRAAWVAVMTAVLWSPAAGATPPRLARAHVASRSLGQAAASALVERGRQLFDGFQYEQAIEVLTEAIQTLTSQPDPDIDGLVSVYGLRARARFANGNTEGAESDFVQLLQLQPEFVLGATISPRVVGLFNEIRTRTIGQLALDVAPLADVTIDGRPYPATLPMLVELTAGDHMLQAQRLDFRPVTEQITIRPGELLSLTLELEPLTSTLEVTTIPAGVEVLIDGERRGTTVAATDALGASRLLLLDDLSPGVYRLGFRRECYVTAERSLTLTGMDDFRIDPVRLEPAVATAVVETSASDGMIYLGGEPRAPAPGRLTDVCEGEHVIEVRSSRGRFVDRREWRAAETITLGAVLRSAFALVGWGLPGEATASREVVRRIERAVADTQGVMVFTPDASDIETAYRAAGLETGESLDLDVIDPNQRRTIGQTLSQSLGTQGIAWLTVVSAEDMAYRLALLADGSGQPDALTLRLSDPVSHARAVERLSRSAPPIRRSSLEASVVDVDGVSGAVVVRVEDGGAAAVSGLVPGDAVVSINGDPVASESELGIRLSTLRTGAEVTVGAMPRSGEAKVLTLSLGAVPDTIPMNDARVVYNKVLLEMEDALQRATTPFEETIARLNVGVTHIQLSNWDQAYEAITQVQLEETNGVSIGTVDYLTGLCLEAIGRMDDARSAFERAAQARASTLSVDGPRIFLLAERKLEMFARN